MKDILRLSDLSATDIHHLLDRAGGLVRDPYSASGLLRNDSVVLCFDAPSTRTRLSFETAITRLGGHSVFVARSDLQLARGETLEDTARVATYYARAWVMRSSRHEDVERFARAATIPVVNALTNAHHPCQGLTDLLTIKERFGTLAGVRVAYIGAANHVANSLMEGAALTGVHLRLACPRQHSPDGAMLAQARRVALEHGGVVEVHDDPRAAVENAQVVYTTEWPRPSDDRSAGDAWRAAFEPFRVDAALMARAASDAVFMHCLPCRRGEEVTADVIDGPRSIAFEQSGNRVHTSVVLLDSLLRLELAGAVHDR